MLIKQGKCYMNHNITQDLVQAKYTKSEKGIKHNGWEQIHRRLLNTMICMVQIRSS